MYKNKLFQKKNLPTLYIRIKCFMFIFINLLRAKPKNLMTYE